MLKQRRSVLRTVALTVAVALAMLPLGAAATADDEGGLDGAVEVPASETSADVSSELGSTATMTVSIAFGAIVDHDANGPDAGDAMRFTFVLTNSGTVPLNGLSVSAPQVLVSPIACAPAEIAPGDAATCAADHTLTGADVDAGTVQVTATAQGTTSDGQAVSADRTAAKTFVSTVSAPDSDSDLGTDPEADTGTDAGTDPTTETSPDPEIVTPPAQLSLSTTPGAVRDLDGNGPDAGDTVRYTLTVASTGPVSDLVVTDPALSDLTCAESSLAGGQSATCSGDHSLTQADVDAGAVVTTSTAAGLDANGAPVRASATQTKTFVATSSFAFHKQAGVIATGIDGQPDVGDAITYGFVFTNTGTTTLTSAVVKDALAGAVGCPSGAVAPGGTLTCTAAYALTQGDIDSGTVGGSATGSMVPSDKGSPDPVPATRSDSASTSVERSAAASAARSVASQALAPQAVTAETVTAPGATATTPAPGGETGSSASAPGAVATGIALLPGTGASELALPLGLLGLLMVGLGLAVTFRRTQLVGAHALVGLDVRPTGRHRC